MGLRDAFVDLVLGGACAGCQEPGPPVCAACTTELSATTPFTAWPDPMPPGLPAPTATAPYDGVCAQGDPRAQGGRPLRPRPAARPGPGPVGPIGARGGAGGVALSGPVDAVHGAPPGPRSVAAGGDRRGEGVAAPGVRRPVGGRTRRRTPAGGPGRTVGRERAANLAGAFAARSRWAERLTDQTILLVDDVLTTGSTLTEAARALSVRGIPVLGCAVVAATPRRPASGS